MLTPCEWMHTLTCTFNHLTLLLSKVSKCERYWQLILTFLYRETSQRLLNRMWSQDCWTPPSAISDESKQRLRKSSSSAVVWCSFIYIVDNRELSCKRLTKNVNILICMNISICPVFLRLYFRVTAGAGFSAVCIFWYLYQGCCGLLFDIFLLGVQPF